MPARRGPSRIEHDPDDCPLCEARDLREARALRPEVAHLREALDDAEGRYSAVYQAKCLVDAKVERLTEENRELVMLVEQLRGRR